MKSSSILLLGSLCVTLLAGCPAGETEGPKVPDKPAGDVTLTGFEALVVKGKVYKPAALGAPNMLTRKTDKIRRTIERQKTRFEKARSSKKDIEMQLLVSMIWKKKQAEIEGKDPAAQQAGLAEAANEIIELVSAFQASNPKEISPITLRQLFTSQLLVGNDEGARKTVAVLLEKLKEQPHASTKSVATTWGAFLHLRAGDLESAKKLIAEWPADIHKQEGKAFEAYVKAWIFFYENNTDALIEALDTVAKGWTGNPGPVVQEIHFLASRRLTSEQATKLYTSFLTGAGTAEQVKRAKFLYGYSLATEYSKFGKFQEAIKTLDWAVTEGAPEPNELVRIRFEQGQLAVMANMPKEAANRFQTFVTELAECGDKCAKEAEQLSPSVVNYGHHFHSVYASTFDEKYFEPAKAIYQSYVTLGRPDAEQITQEITNLQKRKEAMIPSKGIHNNDRIGERITLRASAVQGCYEKALRNDPELTGSVSMKFTVGQDGMVSTVSLEGVEDKTFVDCMTETVKAWTFPGRTLEGVTNVDYPITLELAK